jgi:hypothetical protein
MDLESPVNILSQSQNGISLEAIPGGGSFVSNVEELIRVEIKGYIRAVTPKSGAK